MFIVPRLPTVSGTPYDAQKATVVVLLGMTSSSHWHPHIVAKRWKLLDYLASVPDGPQPLRRCIGNMGLMDMVKNALLRSRWENQNGRGLIGLCRWPSSMTRFEGRIPGPPTGELGYLTLPGRMCLYNKLATVNHMF